MSLEESLREFLGKHSEMDDDEINEEIDDICRNKNRKRSRMIKEWEDFAECKIPEYSEFLSPGDYQKIVKLI